MTIETLEKLKTKYSDKRDYFKNLDFSVIAADFDDMVLTITEMIAYLQNDSKN
jgi:hypothetical protein